MTLSTPTRPHLRCALLAALCAVLLTVAAVEVPQARAVAPPQRDYFGINAQDVFKLPQDHWDHQLAAMARTGIGVVRRDAFWSNVEPTAPVHGVHHYTWTKPDAVVAALARHGLRWYPILDYSTPWAGSASGPKRWKSAPTNPEDFADYSGAFAARYGTDGSFWQTHPLLPARPVESYEVWNEPNLSDFWPDTAGAAVRYADLLAATLAAVRGADPAASVVVGGLSPSDLTTFLDGVEQRQPGLIASADAVAFHPYGTTFANTGARVHVLRDWLDRHGAATSPIEITETGWATPPLPETTRARRMAALVPGLVSSSCDITRFIAQTWLTPDVDASDPNDFFGVANPDATLKPTGAALVDAIDSVEDGTATAASDPCADRSVPPTPSPAPGPAPALLPPSPAPTSPAPSPPAHPSPAPTSPASPPTEAGWSASAPAASSVPTGFAVAPMATPAPPATQPRLDVVLHRRGGDRIVVAISCTPGCRADVRVKRPHGALAEARASRRFARRQRVILRLPAGVRGPVRVQVRATVRGAPSMRAVRTLR